MQKQKSTTTKSGSPGLKLTLLILVISITIVIGIFQQGSNVASKGIVRMGKLVACDFEVFGIVQERKDLLMGCSTVFQTLSSSVLRYALLSSEVEWCPIR
uniref:CSON013090 protein n=1 Tax=Culicoides sonorensis TaxID=179676 RepID=A0A336M729_CULSO